MNRSGCSTSRTSARAERDWLLASASACAFTRDVRLSAVSAAASTISTISISAIVSSSAISLPVTTPAPA